MKRRISLLLALVMVFSLCSILPAGAAATEKLSILYPGTESDAMTAFLQGPFAEKVKADLNMEVEFTFLPWDQYWEQKDIMLAAQRPIDLYWDGLPDLASMVNKKQAQPLDELLAQYGQDMKKVLPDSQLAGGKVNGVQYGIPTAYAPSSGMYQFVCLRQDLLEAVGMTEVKTPEDLKQYATLVAEQLPQYKGPADPIFKPLTRYFADEQYFWVGFAELAVFGEETQQAYSYAQTEAFKKVAQYNRDMYLEGLYSDDLTIKYNERTSRIQSGLYLWGEGSLGKANEIIGAVQANDPTATLESYLLAPEKPRYINATGGEVICVPYSAQNPAGAVKFLNWLYSSQENYLFCLYGVKGTDYDISETGRLIPLSDAAKGEGYLYEWMFRNVNYQVFPESTSQEYIDTYLNWDKDAKVSGMLGFKFNNANVVEVETACNQVFGQKLAPILYGFVDFETEYPAAIEELKAAGIDQYIAEINKQLEEFKATQK